MEFLCDRLNLFRLVNGVIRVPFLVKGVIVAPPELSVTQVKGAFSNGDNAVNWVELPGALIVREPIIDRDSLRRTGDWVYQVMPLVQGRDLIDTDSDKLARELYPLKVNEILDYLDRISDTLRRNPRLIRSIIEVVRLTSEFPDAFLNGWFAAINSLLDRETARRMIDRELSLWGKPGTGFLDGWVLVEAEPVAGLASSISKRVLRSRADERSGPSKVYIRAAPTRQLHITSGNALAVPLISALRAILTKSAAVVKLPYGATVTGALFAVAAHTAAPEHPITRNLSLVYWHGGDDEVERAVFGTGEFDRVVVWGSGETMASVKARVPSARVVAFNPRYSVSLIGQEAFAGDIEEVAELASADSLIDNQKSCSASLVHYVEGTGEQVAAYAMALQTVLQRWDAKVPGPVTPAAAGQIKRLRLGRYQGARWYLNELDGRISSGVVLMSGEFDMQEHPACRFVVVRTLDKLSSALRYLHGGVSTVGVYPETQRLALMDTILSRGVSNVLPLGQCERTFIGMPHDGAVVLNQLVDWKTT
jgi:hypothetical protein